MLNRFIWSLAWSGQQSIRSYVFSPHKASPAIDGWGLGKGPEKGPSAYKSFRFAVGWVLGSAAKAAKTRAESNVATVPASAAALVAEAWIR